MKPWNKLKTLLTIANNYQLIPGNNMGRDGMRCVRASLIVLNVVLALLSCAALGLGIWMHILSTGTARLIAQYATISSSAFMLAVGVIGIFVCIGGWCGAWFLNRCLLMTYFIVVLLLFLLEVGLVIYFLIFRDTMVDNFRYEQKLSLRTNYLPHTTLAKIWDGIQETFGCCGMDSPADWHYIGSWPELAISPDSCCIPEARQIPNCGKTMDYRTIYPRGCFEVIRDYVTRNMYIFALAAAGLVFIQLLGLIFSMVLFCAGHRIHEELVIVDIGEPEIVQVRRIEEVPVLPPRSVPPLPVKIKPAYVETNL